MRALLLFLLLSPTAMAGSQWSIDWHSIDGGGVLEASVNNWSLSGTIGQADATALDALAAGPWQLTGGFWAVLLAGPPDDRIFRDRFEFDDTLPAFTFSEHLAATFRHPRCVTCHAVAATDFRRVNDDPPGVLPASHPVVDATTNCVACHSSALLPPTGTIDPGWQSAPVAFDFRDLSDNALCNLASQPTSGHTPLEHMTEDRLVLWAVGDGRVPFGNPTLPTAPPHDIEQWRSLIQQWVAGGMVCE